MGNSKRKQRSRRSKHLLLAVSPGDGDQTSPPQMPETTMADNDGAENADAPAPEPSAEEPTAFNAELLTTLTQLEPTENPEISTDTAATNDSTPAPCPKARSTPRKSRVVPMHKPHRRPRTAHNSYY
ncbi:uncharacterized protein EMH_0055100 [Eimeria mitis]|uniref:Uncharacterized protein n=1 Tax=Eimeria mitis TaxID=44415 RepID=U6JX73_9EIME|nr:uncharacterized protein EMH_0055100 [Eimeria mitis]CDJ30080.1 hypothetical protein EMH_0055100 [Eimeria mitis]